MKTYLLPLATVLCSIMLQSCSDNKPVATVQPIKVVAQEIKALPIDGSASFSGTVEEESGSAISFSAMGTVERVYVEAGQTVGKGTLIATIDPATARNAYDATLAARQQAEDAYARMKQLHDAGSLPEIQWIEVQSKLRQAISSEQIAKKSLTDCKLYAPFAGYISEKPVEAGQNVIPGMTVAKIVKIDRVKIKISVPEDEIASVKKGQMVTVWVDALGGRQYTGRVTERGVVANPLSRSYDVKVTIDNPRHELLPGMVCLASFADSNSSATAVMLPARIVQIDIDNRPFVWIIQKGTAHKNYVTTGDSHGDNVVITSGLQQGDKVIVNGQQKVSEGTAISY